MPSSKRKLRKRVKLLEAVCGELIDRIETLEGDDSGPRKWKDCYVTDLDPAPSLADELQDRGPLPGYLWDDDDWSRGSYL